MRYELLLALPATLWLTTANAVAQPAPAEPTPGQPTPPIAPKLQEVPLPPAVELPAPPTPAEVPERPLTADEAARIALYRQPNVVIAASEITAAQGRIQQAQSAGRPQVVVGAGYTHRDTISGTGSGSTNTTTGTDTGVGTTSGTGGTTPGYQTSVSLRQLLFDFNRTRNAVRQAAAQERAATANLTRVQADLVLQVKQGFYATVQNQRLVGVAETNLRNRQDQLALAQARLGVGLGLPFDVVRAQTAVAEAAFTLDQARNTASVSRVTLALAMGIDPRTPLQAADSDEAAIATDDVNALVDTALRQRPEMLQAQANLDAASAGIKAAKATNAPAISANLGVNSRDENFPPRNSSLSTGVILQWTPFNGGLTRGLVKEAQAAQQAAQGGFANARQTVISDVAQAYLNLRTAEQRVVTANVEVANAEESVRLAQGRYRAGVGTFLEVTDAQAALLTAQTNRVNALSGVNQARAALNRAVGAALPAPLQ